jgi:hypothetical protein
MASQINPDVMRKMPNPERAGQHVTLAPPNYQMAGQAFLGSDMRGTLLLAMDDRGGA